MLPRLTQRLELIVRRNPILGNVAKRLDLEAARARHTVAAFAPSIIVPQPRQLTIAVTADCNLRCKGCRYGRDFMSGHRLSLATIKEVLDDAWNAGITKVRFYGGEPLLHPHLPDMVAYARALGLMPYVTTNGTHLKAKGPALYEAGLRLATIGFYGLGESYNEYTQRSDHFRRLEESLTATRAQFGKNFELQLNFVVMRNTCTLEALHEAWAFAKKYDMYFHLDLINYAPPFFVQGFDNEFHLQAEDRPRIESVVVEMLALKKAEPARFLHSTAFLRSIPDWLLKGRDMKVPCDAYQLIWIGADGTVQLCDVTLKLGNVNQTRLRDMLFTPEHTRAARDGFQLKCLNCTCKVETRIQKHGPSLRRYSQPLAGEAQ